MKIKKHHKSNIYILFIVIVLIASGFVLTKFITKPGPKVAVPSPAITSLPLNQSNNTSDKSSQPATNQVVQTQGVDQNGQKPSTVNSNKSLWTISQSGLITVESPYSNSKFSSGDSIYGLSTLDKVQYTLIDNQVGVISQGFINVVNGSFSSKVSFQKYASSGRLDVFSTTGTGKEENIVEIPVNL